VTTTIAITGASGYLGTLLTQGFGSRGWRTVALVRTPRATSDREFTLGTPPSAEVLAGVDVLIHAAYDMAVTSEADIRRINVEGTRLLLQAANDANVTRVIVLSSMSAYGGTTQLYGRAKLEIEADALRHRAVVARPGLVIGPKCGGMAGALAKLVALPITPTVRGAGHQFSVDAQEFVDTIYLLATTHFPPAEPVGIASPNPVPFNDLLRAIASGVGMRPPRLFPIPWQMIYGVLRLGEATRIKLPFRADSLLGLVRPAHSVPGVSALSAIQASARATSS
jgi:nucleoside-diphosphate-sugar epimerase